MDCDSCYSTNTVGKISENFHWGLLTLTSLAASTPTKIMFYHL